MRIKWRKRNLSPESENWGRQVEQEIDTLRSNMATLKESAENNNSQTNTALNSLRGVVEELQAQSDTLAAQQQQILDTIDKLSTAAVWWQASTNVLIAQAPNYTDLAVITGLTVPTGYSKALIMAVSQVDMTAYSSSAFEPFQGGVATVIGGQSGWLMPVHGYPQYEIDLGTSVVQAEYQATTSASSSTVRYMENLSENQQITVATRLQVGAGDTSIYGTATTSCQAIFFK
jgi:hypothetical protein